MFETADQTTNIRQQFKHFHYVWFNYFTKLWIEFMYLKCYALYPLDWIGWVTSMHFLSIDGENWFKHLFPTLVKLFQLFFHKLSKLSKMLNVLNIKLTGIMVITMWLLTKTVVNVVNTQMKVYLPITRHNAGQL